MSGKSHQSAVITGASSGLGKAYALAWARRGWRIGVVDIDAAEGERTVEEIENVGGRGEFYRCDVRDLEEVQAMAEHFFASWGGVGVLVNNAGVFGAGLVGEIPIEDWRRVIDVNFWGVVHGCHAFIPLMKERGNGHIVNTASAGGVISTPETAPYNSSKAGVIAVSETIRSELSAHGIGVTVVCPTFVDTHLLSSMTVTPDTPIRDISGVAFEHSRMDAGQIAEKVVRAVEKNRLYVFPQLSSKVLWVNKRLFPGRYFALLSLLYRYEVAEPLFFWLARHGMI
ncbi:MAG: SDR family NAD(P)-dependent oxidoreductase [Actinobacteria bacterium]|nr:SDR family NAD(P)-dependent oxidoreductase [Actinomycetota bacterium]